MKYSTESFVMFSILQPFARSAKGCKMENMTKDSVEERHTEGVHIDEKRKSDTLCGLLNIANVCDMLPGRKEV